VELSTLPSALRNCAEVPPDFIIEAAVIFFENAIFPSYFTVIAATCVPV